MATTSSSSSSSPKSPSPLDTSMLREIMDKLQIQEPAYLDTDSLITNTCDKVLEAKNDKSAIAKETAKLEQRIVRIILSGNGSEQLKPNSGQSVEVGGHHICVGVSDRSESGYMVWQWHGHIMMYDEEKGFQLEYVYGNYFQKLKKEDDEDKGECDVDEDSEQNSVLQELMAKADEINARILCRNISLASKR